MSHNSLIFDIVRGSTIDGPGLRTVVFMKGCPLRCIWCHNPESMEMSREIAIHKDRCVGCGACFRSCPNLAIDSEAGPSINRNVCRKCGSCAENCDTLALKTVGSSYSKDDLLGLIFRDNAYYETSGGGITFSGGEPLLHMEYLEPVMRELKRHGLHIAVETCGYFDYEIFNRKLLKLIDLMLFDVKLIDPEDHKKFTGKSNKKILENLKRLQKEKSVEILPRIPLIPRYTATDKNIMEIAGFLKRNKFDACSLLSYNPSGLEKQARLGRTISGKTLAEPLSINEERRLRKLFYEHAGEIDFC